MHLRRARLGILRVLNPVSVFPTHRVPRILTTMPSKGFSARLAIPVLNARLVMSTMAAPVVSEPVPAVVGIAMSGRSFSDTGVPFPTGALMKSKRSASL